MLFSSRKVFVLEDPRGPIFKSLTMSYSSRGSSSPRKFSRRLTWVGMQNIKLHRLAVICHCAPVRFKFMSVSPYCLTAVLLSSRKVLVIEDPRGPIFKSSSLSSSMSLSPWQQHWLNKSETKPSIASRGSCAILTLWKCLRRVESPITLRTWLYDVKLVMPQSSKSSQVETRIWKLESGSTIHADRLRTHYRKTLC